MNSKKSHSNNSNKVISGLIKRHPDGFGFFIPEDKELPDVYVPQQSMKSAMTNDRVTLIAEKERDGRFRGEIINITERSHKRIAGKFVLTSEKMGSIKDEGRGWGYDLKISVENSMNAKSGELVEAVITTYPDQGTFEGKVASIIGDAKDPLNDIKRVVITQNIPDHFSQATLDEATKFSKNPEEKDFKNRKDLRHLPIITIDGATAKDFDDAVMVDMTDTGFHLYVAIADVSHYVSVGSSIDKEAYERGTSVYFPNFVIPMLPEALSNGLCSLNPHVPRLALVAEMSFDFTGEMTSSDFYEGVIESKARVTYGEAQELIDGANIAKLDHVKETIFRCADLAKVLMAHRFKNGSLDLEVPETELVIDGTGQPVDVIKSERLFAHRLIEELMLAANVAVAKFFTQKEIPAMYRIHEVPAGEKISNLQKYLSNLGYNATLDGGKLQKRLTRALQEFEGKPEAQIVNILTLRSMSQAKYSHNNLGHFGLGFDFYTHFTSPIRRYPDLIVHRLLKNLVVANSHYRLMNEEDLSSAGTWLSACEQRSAKAERQIQAIKKARFMEKLVGKEFDGLISSVTKFGVFVLLREFNIDGLVKLDDLGPDKWEFDEENLMLVAKRSGFKYKMGDIVKVCVSLVDVEQGQVNFTLIKDGKEVTTSARQSERLNQKSYAEKKYSEKGRTDKNGRPYKKSDKKDYSENKSKSAKPSGKKDFKQNKSRPERPFAEKKEFFAKKTSFFQDRVEPKAVASPTSGPDQYQPKPRYTSLSDYLDQKRKVSSHEEKPEKKSTTGTPENRSNYEKRSQASNDSDGFHKARSKKSSRKNKSR